MKAEIKVPAMGESITEATVGQIIKPTGSIVKVDDEVLELETDKVNQVLYAPASGVITLNVSSDQAVKIGQVIGYVESNGAAAEKPKEVSKKEPIQAAPPKQTPPKPEPVKPKASVPLPEKKPAASSQEAGSIRLTKENFIQNVSEGKSSSKQTSSSGKPETRTRMTKIRQVISKRLVEAKNTTAMLTTFNEADLSKVIQLREKYKETFEKDYGVKLGFMSFFVKAVVWALQETPELNSYIDGDEIVHRDYYDIGIAVGTDRGLVVPVVRNCDKLTFAEIERAIAGFAKQAKEGTLSVDDMQGGGFTITNGGTYGSLLSTPILNMPQSGILGMHKIQKRPIVVDDQIVIRPMMYLAMSYDHRIVDGKGAVTFLVHVKDCLEDPARLMLEV